MPASHNNSSSASGRPSRRHRSQPIYGLQTKKSYRGQETTGGYGFRIVLIAILLAVLVAAVVLGAATLT